MSPTWAARSAVGVTLLLWASAFVAIRHLRDDFSPGALSLGRVGIAAICLGLVQLATARARRRTSGASRPPAWVGPTPRQWGVLVVIGVLWFCVYHLALNEGERRVDAGTAAMLIQVSPVLIALLAALVLRERFTATLALGLALAFAGVAVIALGTSAGGGGRDALGSLLCLVAAAAYAVSAVLQKPLLATLGALQVTWLACSVGALALLPFVGGLVADLRSAPASSILWVVYLGVGPTAVAFTTYAVALRTMSAASLGVTTYLLPPLTILLGLVFLGETPPVAAYAGGVLALVGVAVARRTPRTPAIVPNVSAEPPAPAR